MRIGLLGPLRAEDTAGRPVKVGGQRVRALLILLALDAGRVVPAYSLIERLWGDGDDHPADAPNALQSLVSRLRTALRDVASIDSSPVGYRLAIPPESVDVNRFETLARDGARALADGDPATAARFLREALGLWRGPALADVADASFALASARRLEELRATATLGRIEADLLLGADVIPELRSLTAADPLAERPRALLMRALVAAGRQASALDEYQEARELLADRLGVDPAPSLEQAYLEILRQDHSPRRTQDPAPPRRSSPTWLTSFVGRDDDVSGVLKRLAEDRLVTLTGPGGVGKTRLAAQVAGRLGVPTCFAELAPVTDPGDVPRAVLGALGLKPRRFVYGGTEAADPLARLCDGLGGQRLTLVLDNCEHVITAAAELAARVLTDCPQVRIMATSREPLRIDGETLLVLSPLPDPAAIELMRDRALAVRPGFDVTPANASAVARICRALDGMPLAIELAAAWLRFLTPPQLAERLDDRFALLTGGSRTALPRHQTLRAVVDWSWDLLTETEQVLARRLAVFPAGATLAIAEAVCADTVSAEAKNLPRGAVLPALSGLVAKSILAMSEDLDAAPRYRMLETVRAYCLERLTEAGEDAYVQEALADYYLSRAETGDPLLRTAGQAPWFREFAAEQDNMFAALRGAIARGDAETALRFVRALAYYWVQRGRGEGHTLAAEVLALPVTGLARTQRITEGRVISAFLAAGPVWDMDSVRPAMTAAIADLDECSAGGFDVHPVAALVEPMLALHDSDPERALALFRRYKTSSDPLLRASGLFYGASFNSRLGRLDEAEADCRAALDAFRAMGDRYLIAIALLSLAEYAELRADHEAAIALLTEGRAVGAEIGDWTDLWYFDGMLAAVRARAGDIATAREEIARVARGMTALGTSSGDDAATWLGVVSAEVAYRAGDLAEAERCCAAGLATFSAKPIAWWRPYQITALTRLAMIALARGDTAKCRAGLAESLRLAGGWYEHPPLASVLDAVAAYAQHDADGENAAVAAQLLGAAHTIRDAFDESSADAPTARSVAKAALGGPAFDAAYASGRALPRDAALTLAESAIANTC
ncbi:MAG TPA: BTAD domain-containing putative transcriptional regulator [Trebonia sp.]|nr:BTAD domain-containing putative transcriptional regulator [Trebonia sp.]